MRQYNILEIKDLHVYYGQSHALQGISLSIPRNDIMTIVGRNGMGKTTLCNTIMGFQTPRSGSITTDNQSIYGMEPYQIANHGVRYVPQGRRIWPSLSVHEHLKLAEQRGADKAWSIERVYSVFPRLAERKKNGGNQLSGGEQQMLAIGRALLGNPKLIIMDEPTEGLAPVIVDQVEALLQMLVTTEEMSILLIEQNLGVALELSDRIAIMVNGQIEIEVSSAELASNPDMQQHYLGVSGGH